MGAKESRSDRPCEVLEAAGPDFSSREEDSTLSDTEVDCEARLHARGRLPQHEQAVLNRADEFQKRYGSDDPEGAAAVQKLIDLLSNRLETAASSKAPSASYAGSDCPRLGSQLSAFTAPAILRNSGAFVHGTKFKHFMAIMEEGLKASMSDIFMIDEIRSDGRVPGLSDPPEVLILIDEEKARREGMAFDYDPTEGTWRTKGIDGVIRPWFFQRVVDQRPNSRGNVLFQSKDDPLMGIAMRRPPKRLLHATYWENLHGILREGIMPAKNPMSETRRAFGDLLRGAENQVYTVEPSRARAEASRKASKEARDVHYALDIVGLDRPADALITIDTQRAMELGLELEVVQSSDREEVVFIKGQVPPECIVGVEPNQPIDLPPHLMAKIVDPKCFEEVPVIDISRDEREVITQLKYACEVVGFMQIVGHGISTELQEKHMRLQRAFFNLPAEAKLELLTDEESPVRGYFGKGGENLDGVLGERVDGTVPKKAVVDNKEGLDTNGVSWSKPVGGYVAHIFGLPSRLPSEEVLPGFRAVLEEYQDAMFKLSKRLLQLMAIVVGLPRDFFEDHLTNAVATHRLLHYWPIKDFDREIGVGPHTDYGLLTILKQDSVGGLQVLNARDMYWVHAVPVEDAFVVNIGDMLARWTGHRFKSTVHRVVNVSPEERFSVPFFLEPNLDTVIVPGGLCAGPGGPASEEALLAETILDRFYTATGMLQEEHRQAYLKRAPAPAA